MTLTHPDVPLLPEDLWNFRRGERENPLFWSRFADRPQVEGKTVLDVGSGWGSLAVELAQAGAQRVVGLDLKIQLVTFANAYVRRYHPELAERVTFAAIDLQHYPEEEQFDLIVSKDSFEHILDVEGMLQAMKRHLKPGGRIYAGFGPLYPTPYGDHDRRQTILRPWGMWGTLLAALPWGHLFLGQKLIELYNRHHPEPITSLRDLGLNTYAWSDYRRAFENSGLRLISLRTNCSTSLPSRFLTSMRRLFPALENYLTHNVYCILEEPVSTVAGS
jgi:SAM-dependent methyltransferase